MLECRAEQFGKQAMPEPLETYRATVAPAQCDHLGHMNVQCYFGMVSDGMFALMTHIGLSRAEVERRRLAFAVVHAESDFRRELMAGEVVYLKSAALAVGGKSATFRHRLHRADDDSLAFETVFKCVLLDLDKRAGTDMPDDLRAALASITEEEGG
jgi:acyl-CoA thioester hydrolase